jgi:hypothetical protein
LQIEDCRCLSRKLRRAFILPSLTFERTQEGYEVVDVRGL